MLDFIRNHKRLMLIILALFVVPGLGLVGIQGFRGFFDDSANVAKVGGQKIPRQEYDNAMREQLDRARQMLGASFDPKMFDTPTIRQGVLEGLIQQRVVAQAAQNEFLTAPDTAVRRAIVAIPAIQALQKPDGTFDVEQYRQLLATQGMTPEQFDERVRFDLASHQPQENIQDSALAPSSLAQHLLEMSQQQREVQSLAFQAQTYRSQIQPTDGDLKQYYASHQDDFRKPESATIDYLVLDAAALSASAAPSDAEVHKYYEDNLAHYQIGGQVRASHILITVAPHASATERQQAQAKAQAILAEVRAHPERFAEIAKKESQDAGSAANGGDLGYFSRGMMVKPFEDAAFSMKPQQISDLVQSDFGYHIIEVTDVKPATTQPFEQVKDAIAQQLRTQEATKRLAEDADQFSNLTYEQGDSLKPAADKFKLQIRQATVTRQPNPALAPTDPLNNQKLLDAVFANDSLKSHHNTAAIDVGSNAMISAHVTAYQAAAVPPFEQVRDAVLQHVLDQRSAELARKSGAAKLAELQKSNAVDGFSAPVKISRASLQGVPPTAASEIFKTPADKLPAYVGVDLGAGGYAIYRINSVIAGSAPTSEQLKAAEAQIAQVSGASQSRAYLAALRQKASVKIYTRSLNSAPVDTDGP
ncbi:MAG: SurA N-terminal domain-containing protein [Janthinobacterium lividum]